MEGKPLRVVDERRLEGAIGAGGEVDLPTRHARYDDDRGRVRFFEPGHGGIDNTDGAHDVGLEPGLPGGRIPLYGQRADIRHDDVDTAERLGRGREPGADGTRIDNG